MKRVVAARNARGAEKPVVEWKYVVFSWNDRESQVETAIRLAKEAGVDLISFVHGGAPPEYTSRRYFESSYFQNLGEKAERGREIWFRR